MPASREVPTAYTSRWKASTPQTTARGLATPASTPPSFAATCKYNTSCNACRKARVKCSGGKPCRKCAASDSPSSCAYSVSRRRGKRKASEGPYPGARDRVDATIQADPPDFAALDSMRLLQDWLDPFETAWPGPQLPWLGSDDGAADAANNSFLGRQNAIGDIGYLADTPALLTGPPASITPPDPSPLSSGKPSGPCPDACFASVHAAGNRLIATLNERGSAGLDRCMAVLEGASIDARRYLACSRCDTGCTRLMTLSLMHQRQLSILCDISTNPSLYDKDDSPRVTLGVYTAPRECNFALKRVILLEVARGVRGCVDALHERVRGFEERVNAGTMEIAEAGRLNLRWLLGIAANLTRRLDTIQAVLKREDWGVQE